MARECASLTEDKIFAKRLREVMDQRDEKPTTLAAKIRAEQGFTIQRQSISQYMAGQSFPDTERLTAICKALDVSADYLLGFTEYETPDSNARSACEYTGLSEEAIDSVRGSTDIEMLNRVLISQGMDRIIRRMLFLQNAIYNLEWELGERTDDAGEKIIDLDELGDEYNVFRLCKYEAIESFSSLLEAMFTLSDLEKRAEEEIDAGLDVIRGKADNGKEE